MTVYVDEVRDWTLIAKARGLRYTHWCHLTAGTEAELHAFAARLGLRRSWSCQPRRSVAVAWRRCARARRTDAASAFLSSRPPSQENRPVTGSGWGIGVGRCG